MKKFIFFATVSALAILSSCTKESHVGETVTIKAAISQAVPSTKTAYVAGGNYSWTASDKISVGTSDGGYVTFDVVDPAAGSFSHTFGGVTPSLLVAVSPVQSTTFTSETDFQVQLPAVYDNYVSGTANALMIGVPATSGSYTFKFARAAGLLKVTYENAPVGTTGLTFQASGNITGTISMSGISVSGLEITSSNPGLTGNTVDLNLAEATTAVQDLEFFIPVPTGNYTSFSMNLKGSADIISSTSKQMNANVTLSRGQNLILPVITLQSGFTPVTVGATDNSANFGEAKGEAYAVPAGKVLHLEFTNYSGKAENFHNWILLCSNTIEGAVGYYEYFAIRPDNWGWSAGDAVNYNPARLVTTGIDWAAFKNAMDGASVTITVEHTTSGSAIVKATCVSSDNNYTFTTEYSHPVSTNEDIYTCLWFEKAHGDIKKVWYSNSRKTSVSSLSTSYNYYVYEDALDLSIIGGPKKDVLATYNDGETAAVPANLLSFAVGTYITPTAGNQTVDVTFNGTPSTITIPVVKGTGAFGNVTLVTGLVYSPFFGDVAPGTPVSKTMYVYSSCANNWASPCADCASAGFAKFYASFRMDNYGWGDNYSSATPESNWDWGTFAAMQNHNTVVITWTNNTTTADVRFDATYWTGETHYQSFIGLTIENGELAYRAFTENSYVVVLD